ncbi:hypothetical protein Leryth_007680 [Lithospermum erythrorhizon]|nr:hypothetical protein Leryth_007680 [Lithospermum erythrorhizon]
MELRGLFQYLVNQLKKGIGIELVLLQELIQHMANVQYTENMTEEQLDAMAGSDTLRYHATSYGIVRNNKTFVKSMNRLRDALLPKEDPKLAIPLLLLIAQHRSLVVINANVPHIKMVSEQFDRCHGTLLQYVDFLSSAVVPSSTYSMMVPTLDELARDYHLDPEVAFLVYRPVMRLFKCRNSSDAFWPSYEKESADCLTVHKDSAETDLAASLVLDLGPSRKPISWSDLLDTVKTMLPSKAWNSLSPDLYATFWGLTLYDLYVPRSRYESEIAKQHAAIRALEEYSDNSSSAIMKRKKDKEKIQESLDRLSMELEKHEDHVASVRRRLAREKDTWLSSCLDTLKINMEFLQRCIFPRCTFSMSDAVYCAMFVNTLHALGTPFFNTVNHIDVLICKTVQPMICCCTEYEVGRLGRFLFETLKTAYYWKKDESIYERECGNMPGFAVYYRYPNSQRVTYGQFIKVHWKWSQRITRLLIQCLESTEYMEIRNALILLTKISSVFPVTRKSGINIEKRVAKIKSEEREDLKVLATGVAAALASRKPSWVTDEEFGMGYLEIKPVAAPPSKPSVAQNGAGSILPHGSNTTRIDGATSARDSRTRTGDARVERAESASLRSDPGNTKLKGGLLPNGSEVQAALPQPGTTRSVEHQTRIHESTSRPTEDISARGASKTSAETEGKGVKRSAPIGSVSKQDLLKDEGKHAKIGNGSTSAISKGLTSGKPLDSGAEIKSETVTAKSSESKTFSGKGESAENFDGRKQSSTRSVHSPRRDNLAPTAKSIDKLQKRTSPAEELEKANKRRKGEADLRDLEGVEGRLSERERSVNMLELDKPGSDDHISNRVTDKVVDKVTKKGSERHDRDSKERPERIDKSRGEDFLSEKLRERSVERYGRERSVDRLQERGAGRDLDRLNRDERNKLRHGEPSTEKALLDERSHGQGLPPPPPLPPYVVPQSLSAGRRDDDADRRFGSSRHGPRLSPRHEERERRRSEENPLVIQDDVKRRRDDDFHDRKREDRDSHLIKVDDRDSEREREKAHLLKDDVESAAASKRRKLKREHLSMEPGEYSPAAAAPALSINLSQTYDGRERDRKGSTVQRTGYVEDPSLRIHGKEVTGKTTRRDPDPYPEWDDDKRQRAEQKRRHRK